MLSRAAHLIPSYLQGCEAHKPHPSQSCGLNSPEPPERLFLSHLRAKIWEIHTTIIPTHVPASEPPHISVKQLFLIFCEVVVFKNTTPRNRSSGWRRSTGSQSSLACAPRAPSARQLLSLHPSPQPLKSKPPTLTVLRFTLTDPPRRLAFKASWRSEIVWRVVRGRPAQGNSPTL
jgi:hypothetical protein